MAGKGGSKASAIVIPPVKPGAGVSVSGRNGVVEQKQPGTIHATGKGCH
jgi:hypothetical protein